MNKLRILLAVSAAWIFIAEAHAMEKEFGDSSHIQCSHSNSDSEEDFVYVSPQDREYCKRDLAKELQENKEKATRLSKTSSRKENEWWLEFRIENAIKRSIDKQEGGRFSEYIEIFPNYEVNGVNGITPRGFLLNQFENKRRNPAFDAFNDKWNAFRIVDSIKNKTLPDNILNLLLQDMENQTKEGLAKQKELRKKIELCDKK
jgi:hypothetical protein